MSGATQLLVRLATCLRLTVEKADGKVGIANEGYWGIPVKPSTTYKASFYIKGSGSFAPQRRPGQNAPQTPPPAVIEDNTAGPITVTIESNDGKTVYASGTINLEKSIYWKKYALTLTTAANVTTYYKRTFCNFNQSLGFILFQSGVVVSSNL